MAASDWVPAAIAVLTGVLALSSWRRRREPGATLTVASVLATLWAVASLMQGLATEPARRIVWYGVSISLLLPILAGVTVFIVQYAGLGRLLTPSRVLWALAVPAALDMVLVLTNPLHGLVWSDAVVDPGGAVRVSVEVGGWLGLGYSLVLGLINITALVRLIVVSPDRRLPAFLMLLAHLASRYAFTHEVLQLDLPLPVSPGVLTVAVPFATYAVALFGLHVLDPVPVARRAALEQMSDGVLVSDVDGVVIDANPAAERIFGAAAAELRGRLLSDLVPRTALSGDRPDRPGAERFEVALGPGDSRRHYVVDRSILSDGSGRHLGEVLLVHDVTDQRAIQDRLLEHRQTVARLTEREHLARDLHDSVGQVLGFVSMQAQAIRKRLADGDTDRADALLARLAEVAQQAHAEVRGLILGLKSPADLDAAWSLDASVSAHLREFEASYGITTELELVDGAAGVSLDAATGIEVLRSVQEALTNARRHSGAGTVRVVIERAGDGVRVTVADDGRGFDRDAVDSARQFGLANMRERMEEIGGSLRVDTAPGQGTRVTFETPGLSSEEGHT